MKNKMGICAFRLDDITPDMNWDTFYQLKSVFDKYHIKPLLGVVPDNRDDSLKRGALCADFWKVIRQLQEDGWLIAQHGYRHQYCSNNKGLLRLKEVSEFAGLTYEEQKEKIRRGSKILQKNGIYVTIFMAPGHTFDKNTLKALKENGFLYITDGYSTQLYQRNGIIHIPCRVSAPQVSRGVDTICLHTNHMKTKEITAVEDFIRSHRESIVNYSQLLRMKPVKRGLRIVIEEETNLMWRKIRKSISQNKQIHDYLVETDNSNRTKKWIKRIVNIPRLLVKIIRTDKPC